MHKIAIIAWGIAASATAQPLESVLTPFDQTTEADQIVLKNDGFVDGGGQAYLQLGFVSGEKAGVWVQVPESVGLFKVDYFRVLLGDRPVEELQPTEMNSQIFFHMGIGAEPTTAIPREIENAAQITAGPYWNDIPAQGAQGALRCARGGELIGAALEFTHTGAPSVYRDIDGLGAVKHNTLMAIPGGWNYSVAYGLRGDWVLRVVGHEATAEECGGA